MLAPTKWPFRPPLFLRQFWFCMSIFFLSLLLVGTGNYANGDGPLKEKCWHLPSLLPPKYTHTTNTPFSELSFGPVCSVCLFWLSLKHTLTIAAIFLVPLPFFYPFWPIWVKPDRCWDRKSERCQPLWQTILGYLTLEEGEQKQWKLSCLKRKCALISCY